MMKNTRLIITTIVLAFLFGCHKDDDQPPRQTILVPDKITLQLTGGYFTEYKFSYNENKKISTISVSIYSGGITTSSNVEIAYNPDERISEIAISQNGVNVELYTLTYSSPYIYVNTQDESLAILENNGTLEFANSFGDIEIYMFDSEGQLYSVERRCTQLLTTTDGINGPFKNVEMDEVLYPIIFSKFYYGFSKKGVLTTNNLFCHGLEVDVILRLNSENYVETTTSVYGYTEGDVSEVFNYTYKKI